MIGRRQANGCAATPLTRVPPVDDGVNPQELMTRSEELAKLTSHLELQLPSYFRPIELESLVRACDDAGFVVERAVYTRRDGYPSLTEYDGRESVQLVAMKPLA